jgi:opacity protein-like surface antigen
MSLIRTIALTALVTASLSLGLPARAHAQDSSLFIPYIGTVTSGDTRTHGFTYGFSTAFIDDRGWGGELDVSHSNAFNDVDFAESSLTTLMVNLLAAPRLSTKWVRPYGVAGIGLIRARGCGGAQCVTEFSRTDFGLDIGAGGLVPITDMLGVRGDIRYFRYMQIHQDLPRTDNGPFDFWRISVAGTFTW